MARICPDCGVPLQEENFDGVSIDVCGECAGIWLDRGEIVRIRNLGEAEMHRLDGSLHPSPAGHHGGGACPLCSKPLHPFRYMNGPVELQSCEGNCGLWIRDGQIDQIAEWTRPNPAAIGAMGELEARRQAGLQRAERMGQFFQGLQRTWRRGWY